VDVTRQRHVEFQQVGLEIDEMAQAGIARADIVDRDARIGSDPGKALFELAVILDLVVFGELDHQLMIGKGDQHLFQRARKDCFGEALTER
jgi:hypothetical protein